MSKSEGKDREETEDLTPVRSIVQQINDSKPSHSTKREVVVREDGTKVVRVTRKRRVLMTEREIRHRSRKQVVMFVSAVFLVLCAAVTYFLIQMASMSGEEYMQSRVEELRKAWGADSVRVVGSGISGSTLHISSIVAEFPADCLVEQVEISDLSVDLDAGAFLRERVQGEVLRMKRANIILRQETETMKMPELKDAALWRFERMECGDLSVSWGRGEFVRLALRNCTAHMYYPRKGREDCVVAMKGGTLLIPHWQTVHVTEAKAHLSPVALEDLFISGSVEPPSENAESQRSTLTLRCRIPDGGKMECDFAMSARNMPFSDFTKGRFESFFTARTSGHKSDTCLSKVTFTAAGPVFHGEFELEKIMVTSFPAITAMLEHIEPLKRRQYMPPRIDSGFVTLSTEEGRISIEIGENRMQTRDRLSLKGKMEISPANELSGTLSYGLPGILTRAEYTDGMPDPVFEDKGDWTWLTTELKGFANKPSDNMTEVEARAAEARKSRPERLKFDALDVNKLTEGMKHDGVSPGEQSGNSADGQGGNPFEQQDPFAEPKNSADDPFAPLSPF